MPFYQQRGQIPHKRHTQFPKADGTLHHEQLFGTIGFVGMSSLLYHLHPTDDDLLGGALVRFAACVAVKQELPVLIAWQRSKSLPVLIAWQ